MSRKASACVFGELCSRHGFVHGAEAEELREKIERLIGTGGHEEPSLAWAISNVLQDVDARDSLAWCEHRAKEQAAFPKPRSHGKGR